MRSKLMMALSAGALTVGLSGGAAHATAVTVTADTLTLGGVSVTLGGSFLNSPNNPIANPVTAGRQDLTTSIGALQTYCVDIFHWSSNNATFNSVPLSDPAAQAVTGTSTVASWTSSQVTMLTALLQNGQQQSQTKITTAALQIAIWEIEYGKKLANGSYDLDNSSNSTNSKIFYFSNSSDGNSGTAISQAQTYLDDITNNVWVSNANSTVYELTVTPVSSTSPQNLIYLSQNNNGSSTPIPEPVGLFGVGLAGLLAFARRRRTA